MNKMPDTTIIEPMVEEEENTLPDIKTLPKPSPFVEEKKQEVSEERINLNMCGKKKLSEMCKAKGYRGYSKLTKPNLIKLLNGDSLEDILTQKPKPKKVRKTIDIDTQNKNQLEKKEEIQPKPPIKNEELKNELVKDEPIIKEPVAPKPKPQPAPTSPPKKIVVEKPVVSKPVASKPVAQQQPHKVVPPKQEKALYNPFKQTYRIM